MRLQHAVFVQHRLVADLDEVELDQAGGVEVSAPANPRSEQPVIPRQKRRALQSIQRQQFSLQP
jgi:hypothetical protein